MHKWKESMFDYERYNLLKSPFETKPMNSLHWKINTTFGELLSIFKIYHSQGNYGGTITLEGYPIATQGWKCI